MNSPFGHVASTSLRIHDALILWARDLLREAGLESIEVYGQFPPEGSVAHHIVLFPYALGPEPMLQQNMPAISLVGLARRGTDAGDRVPQSILSLGKELSKACETLGDGQPRVDVLPDALRSWYENAHAETEPWMVGPVGERRARWPTLLWRGGFVLSVRYVVVAADVGRGSYDRTSVGAPMSLPALSVLAAGLHLRRTLHTACPPIPLPPLIESWVAALPPEARGDLELRLAECRAEQNSEIALAPAQDLTTQEFALLMQALQRPLQAALNLQMRFRLADSLEFRPRASIHHELSGKGAHFEAALSAHAPRASIHHELSGLGAEK